MIVLLFLGLLCNLIFSVGVTNALVLKDNKIKKIMPATAAIIFILFTSAQTLIIGKLGQLNYYFLLGSSLTTATFFIKSFIKRINNIESETIFWIFVSCLIALSASTTFSFDDKQYHALNPALWIQQGRIGLDLVVDYTGYYFFNSALLNTYMMTFTKMNFDVFIIKNAFLIFIVLNSFKVIFEKNNNQFYFYSIFIFTLLNPTLTSIYYFFNSPEIFSAILILYLMSLNIYKANKYTALFLGSLLGFICGMKVTFIIFLTPYLSYYLFINLKGRNYVPLLLTVFMFLFFSTFWFLQNWYVTGNPLFPFEFFNLNHIISKEISKSISMVQVMSSEPIPNQDLLFFFGRTKLGRLFTIITLSSFLIYLVHWAKKSRTTDAIFLISLGILMSLVIYPTLPNSGKGEDGTYAFTSFTRFFVLLQLYIPIFISETNLIKKNSKWFSNSILVISGLLFVYKKIYILSIVTGLILLKEAVRSKKILYGLSSLGLAVALFFIPYRLGELPFIASIKPGDKLTFINNYKTPGLFLLGKNLDRSLIKVNKLGANLTPLHLNTSNASLLDLWPMELPKMNFESEDLLKNLEKNQVNYVVFEKLPPQFSKIQEFPLQLELMENSSASKIYDDGYYKVFYLKKK